MSFMLAMFASFEALSSFSWQYVSAVLRRVEAHPGQQLARPAGQPRLGPVSSITLTLHAHK